MTVYEIVTEKIMQLLEQGVVPWQKPWKSSGPPRNLVSKRRYNGINQFMLNCSPYGSPFWLSYKQVQEKKGNIRKGEKASMVIFWKWLDANPYIQADDTELTTTGKIPLLRYYNVFNLEQTEGIKEPRDEKNLSPFSPIEKAEQIIHGMPTRPEIRHIGDQAFYMPAGDYVQMPIQEKFTSPEAYYDALFHELSHSTGHISRLGRKSITEPKGFGSHEYSQEELVAQFSSSMLMGHAGIEQATIENSSAYIQGWLRVMKADKKIAVIAAGQAQKSADYILNVKEEQNQEISD